MAINDLTTNCARWNAALADCDAAQAAFAAVKAHPQGRVRDDVAALAAEAADRVYRVAAPTLGDLRRKLELLFDLWDDAYGTDFKRTVVGDLTRLELLLAGVDPYEASGGMDLERVATDFAEAGREYDRFIKLHRDGPSGTWETSPSNDIATLMNQAEEMLLSLAAPNLGAVEKKLRILFRDDRHNAIDDVDVHTLILCDLRRFISEPGQGPIPGSEAGG